MNWNKYFRIAVRFILLSILFIVTYIQLVKYQKEITNVSISYEELDLELPSVTICLRYDEDNVKQENMTFEEYMKGVLNISKVFDILKGNRNSAKLYVHNTFWSKVI